MNTVLVLAASSLIVVLVSPFSSAALTKITCNTSGIGTCLNPFCYITAAGTGYSGCGNLSRPLNRFFIQQKATVTILGLTLPLSLPADIDYCSYIKNPDQISLISVLFKAVEEETPGSIHGCPYQGSDLQSKNLNFNNIETFLGLLVTEYTITFKFFDSLDNNIFTVTFYGDTRKSGTGGLVGGLLGGLGLNILG